MDVQKSFCRCKGMQVQGNLHLAKSEQNVRVCGSVNYNHQYTTLHYTTLDYTTLHHTTLHYTTLYPTTLHSITLQLQRQRQLQLRLHCNYNHNNHNNNNNNNSSYKYTTTTTTTTTTPQLPTTIALLCTVHYTTLDPLHPYNMTATTR